MHVQYDTDPVVLEVADDGLDVGEVLAVIEALPGLQPRPHGAKSDHSEAPGGQVPGVAGLQQSLVIPGRLFPNKVDSVIDPQPSSTTGLGSVWSEGGLTAHLLSINHLTLLHSQLGNLHRLGTQRHLNTARESVRGWEDEPR